MIQESGYEGEGLKLLYDQGDWVIGIKNYRGNFKIASNEIRPA